MTDTCTNCGHICDVDTPAPGEWLCLRCACELLSRERAITDLAFRQPPPPPMDFTVPAQTDDLTPPPRRRYLTLSELRDRKRL